MQKVVIKLLCIKVYYCWSLANVESPSWCSRSWYLLSKVFQKNITWITAWILIKGLSWPMSMHEINIKNFICSYINETKLMDWILTYDSSLLVRGLPIDGDDNGTKWRLLCVTGTVSPPSHHFSISRFSLLIMLSSQIPKNLIDIISFSHNFRIIL